MNYSETDLQQARSDAANGLRQKLAGVENLLDEYGPELFNVGRAPYTGGPLTPQHIEAFRAAINHAITVVETAPASWVNQHLCGVDWSPTGCSIETLMFLLGVPDGYRYSEAGPDHADFGSLLNVF